MVEERHEKSAEDTHIPVMGGEQGLYFDGIDLIEGATGSDLRGQVKSQDP